MKNVEIPKSHAALVGNGSGFEKLQPQIPFMDRCIIYRRRSAPQI